MAVKVSTEQITKAYGGKEYHITVTTYEGTASYKTPDGREILADVAIHTDYGPKLGEGWDYVIHKDYTPEQRAEGRRHIQEVATQVLIEQGFW